MGRARDATSLVAVRVFLVSVGLLAIIVGGLVGLAVVGLTVLSFVMVKSAQRYGMWRARPAHRYTAEVFRVHNRLADHLELLRREVAARDRRIARLEQQVAELEGVNAELRLGSIDAAGTARPRWRRG